MTFVGPIWQKSAPPTLNMSAVGKAMKNAYARALFLEPAATLDDLREAVRTLEETTRIARRVLGGTHPLTEIIEATLRQARVILQAHIGYYGE